MENLDSEKEELEKLKSWLKENGMSIVLGVVLGLGGVYGWRGWQSHQVTQAENISAQLNSAQQQLANNQFSQAAELARTLEQDEKDSLYADMSRLLLARALVEQGQLDDAAGTLKVISDDKDSIFNTIARLRLARIFLSQSKLDEAEQLTVDSVDNAYAPAFEELRGDLERARGNYAAARTAYLNSMTLANNANTEFLQMKLDDLPIVE
jgi:predicted negative regulator of RcsB-dependent stress response